MRWINTERLQELLAHISGNIHSNFYDKKYTGLPVDEEHFFDLPPLTREDLISTPVHERLYVPKADVRFVAFTSGTSTGKPLMVPFADVERYYFEPSLGTGVTRPLIIHPPLMKSFGHTFLQQCRQAHSPVSPVFGDLQNMDNNALLFKELACDAVYSLPTIAGLFADAAKRWGIAQQVKLLVVSSEMLTAARRADLQSSFPAARIANIYGSAELGQLLFFPCPRMMEEDANQFHVVTEAIAVIELIENELVITYGLNRAMPLLRYRTGDYFEEISTGCVCGLPGPVLAWSHRTDIDRLKLNGIEFNVEDSDRAFAVFPHLARVPYQIHFRPAPGSTAVGLAVEVVAQGPQAEDLARFAEQELPQAWKLTSTATLRTAIERGLVSSFEVRAVPEVSAPSVKVKRFINHVV